MTDNYIENVIVKGIDYTSKSLAKGEYEHCTFVDCLFSNSDLSKNIFSECECEDCDLSMVVL